MRKYSRRMFDIGVKASRVSTGKDAYVCPICLEHLSRNDLESGKLSKEHVPPKSLGGKVLVLTCKRCNSHAGHSFEAALQKRNKQNAFVRCVAGLDSMGPFPVTYSVMGRKINATLALSDDRKIVKIIFSKEHNNPADIDYLSNELMNLTYNGGWEGLESTITTKDSYSQKACDFAYLKSAYLFAFAKLGYRYAMSPYLDVVRRQLMDTKTSYIENFIVTRQCEPRSDFLALVNTPFPCCLVKIERTIVLLPTPSHNVYKQAKILANSRSQTNFKGAVLDLPVEMEMLMDLGKKSTFAMEIDKLYA